MNTTTKTTILFLCLLSFTYTQKTDDTTLFKINPNDQSSFPKEEISEVEKMKNKKTEEIMSNTEPIFTLITTGYLTISSIKNVIIYPFSKKETTINVFYKNGYMLLKDNNDMTIWNYKFDLENTEEIKAFTFINRGTLLLKGADYGRIWPFAEEKMSKKINLSFKQGKFMVTDEDNVKFFGNYVEGKVKKEKHLKTQYEYSVTI